MVVSQAAKLSKICIGNGEFEALRSYIAVCGGLLGVQLCVFAAAFAFYYKLSRKGLHPRKDSV